MLSKLVLGILIAPFCLLANQDSDYGQNNEESQEERERLRKLGPIPLKSLYLPDLSKAKDEKHFPLSDTMQGNPAQDNKDTAIPIATRPLWLYQSALDNAPKLLQGICAYWKNYVKTRRVASYNRLILVGKPGTGKTTLARAIAWHLGYGLYTVSASSLQGRFRNQTAANIRDFFKKVMDDKRPNVVLIDEVHKLFELHKSELSDDAMNAAAFWLALDELEKCAPHVIVIGTANSVSALPPEIQSRFHGKVITIPLPSKEQHLQALTEVIDHDESIILGDSVDVAYIMRILDRLPDSSLRDIQLLLDGAKMFKYAEGSTIYADETVVLEKRHFDQAAAQLRTESLVLQEGWRTKIIPVLKNTALALSVVINIGVITKMAHNGTRLLRSPRNNGTRPIAQ